MGNLIDNQVIGLPQVREHVLRLLNRSDWDRVFPFLDQRWLEVWHAIPPQELAPRLLAAPNSYVARYSGARILKGMVAGNPLSDELQVEDVRGGEAGPEHLMARHGLVVMQRRFAGYPAEAMELAGEASAALEQLKHPMFDTTNGFVPYLYLQMGFTALLASRVSEAQAMLRLAKEATDDARFGFVSRDASFKLAVLHATYGEPSDAESYLEQGEAIARSESWTEVWVDQTAQIARMIIAPDQGVEPPVGPESLASYGEMWPFAMFALVRQAIFRGDLDRAHQIVFEAENIHLSGTVGDGTSAAAIPVSRAQVLLARGLLGEARAAVSEAPPKLVSTNLAQARISYMAGEFGRVIGDVVHTVTQTVPGFSRPRIEFAGILAASYIASGEAGAAHETMRVVLQGRAEIPVSLLRALPSELIDYAAAHWADDPELRALRSDSYTDPFAQGSLYAARANSISLTQREREILGELISGRTMAELAEQLFLSKNTIKTHVSKLYRKLGVSNRKAAVRRGLEVFGVTNPSTRR